jgi:cytochrome c peroxidase
VSRLAKSLCCILTGLLVVPAMARNTMQRSADNPSFLLNEACPASFEKLSNGTCAFRSLYELYSAPDHHGGLRVPLPPHRDGFTPQQVDLGRYLFFDPILSGDHTMSCASCHDPHRGFSDGQSTSLGRSVPADAKDEGRAGGRLERGAPTLWNVGFLSRFFWDARAASLEEQAAGPLFSPREMANNPRALTEALNSNETYRRLFHDAFGKPPGQPISIYETSKALAAFESSLVSVNSRYDRYAHGQADALDETQIAGLNIFRGFVARCSQCHVPPLFTDGELAVVGAPTARDGSVDLGAGALDGDPSQSGAFKVPTLRNVALTAPYFNAGQFDSLEEVVDFYNQGRGHAIPRGVTERVHWHVAMPKGTLSQQDVHALVEFLKTLTDESLLPRIPSAVPSGLAPIVSASPVR